MLPAAKGATEEELTARSLSVVFIIADVEPAVVAAAASLVLYAENEDVDNASLEMLVFIMLGLMSLFLEF